MPRLIVFDFDDTLVDSQQLYKAVFMEYCREARIADPCWHTLFHGYHDKENVLFWEGMSFEDQKNHLDEVYRRFDDETHPTIQKNLPYLFDETENTLKALRDRGYTQAIVTGRRRNTLDLYLDHHNMLEYFSAIRTRDDRDPPRNEPIKPEPHQLISVMKELGFTPENTLVIGDTTMDVEMGQRAGVKSVAVTWGCHDREVLEAVKPDYILDDHLLKLLDVIDELWPELHLTD